MSRSKRRAMSKMRAICVRGSASVYGQPPMTSAPCSQACTSSSSAPGSLVRPSCGKGANLQIDRPLVIALEPAHGVEALEPDARIDFDVGAHAGRALDDGFLQGALRAGVNVRLGEGTLSRCNRCDRLLERAL